MSTPTNAEDGKQLCVVYFMRPVTTDPKTVVRPNASRKLLDIPELPGAFRFCLAEFPCPSGTTVPEDMSFEQRVSRSGMYYCDAVVRNVELLAEEPKHRELAQKLRDLKCDDCFRVETVPGSGEYVYFPLYDGDHLLHTKRNIEPLHVIQLRPRKLVCA